MPQHAPIEGKKILVTGPTGQVAMPLTLSLAQQNEVWGVARFSNPDARKTLEEAGVTCTVADLVEGDFGDLPDDFDYVLNLAVSRATEPDFDADLKANAEAAGLLMAHCRKVTAFLHCSSTAVYEADGHEIFHEASPLGDNHRCMMPTYSIAKISAEAVVRFAARQFQVPTVIGRLNTPYGNNGGWMYYHLEMMKHGVEIPVHTNAPSLYTPIHEDDIFGTLPGMLAAASIPARVINWCGSEHVSIEEWCQYMAELCGLEAKFKPQDGTLESVQSDNALMRALVGDAQVGWKDGIKRMIEAKRPEYLA